MKISFHGAARVVTGSKHLLHINPGKKVLLDCGMFQGMGKETIELNSHWGFEPREVDHLILSHAHIDHIGLVPKLVKDGFPGKIYCTPATASLAKLLLLDSARIQEADAKYVNKQRDKQGREHVEPLYTEEEAAAVFPLFETIPYNEHYKIDDQVRTDVYRLRSHYWQCSGKSRDQREREKNPAHIQRGCRQVQGHDPAFAADIFRRRILF